MWRNKQFLLVLIKLVYALTLKEFLNRSFPCLLLVLKSRIFFFFHSLTPDFSLYISFLSLNHIKLNYKWQIYSLCVARHLETV